MKKCEGCGAYYSDFDRVCPHCGRADETMAEEQQVPVQEENADVLPGMAAETDVPKDPYHTNPETTETTSFAKPVSDMGYSMKWHHFLMVTMIIGSVLTVISAFPLVTGTSYPDSVYNAYPKLKSIDMIYGLASIAVAVFQIMVRNRLNSYRSDGPRMLMMLYGVTLVVNVVYMLSLSNMMAQYGIQTSAGTQIIGQIIAIVIVALINRSYYNKRKSLFVN